MSTHTATTIFVQKNPIITLQKVEIPNLPTSKLHFSSNFINPETVSRQKRSWDFNTMNKPFEISSFNGNSDNYIEGENSGVHKGAFEQEGLINGSSRFSPILAPNQFEAILNNMSKWLISAIFITVGFIRHDALVLWAAMGSVINVLLSNLLKKIINQERPVSALKDDPGMPSSHAQSIFFIFLFAIISMIEGFGVNGLTVALSGLTLVIGSYLSWLRVSQKLHTINQILVGAAVGSIFSILWFWSWGTFMRKLFFTSLWVRIIVVLGAAGFSVGFTLYALKYWIRERK